MWVVLTVPVDVATSQAFLFLLHSWPCFVSVILDLLSMAGAVLNRLESVVLSHL